MIKLALSFLLFFVTILLLSEIIFFVEIGKIIGLLPLVLFIIGSAILGGYILGKNGALVLSECSVMFKSGKLPSHEMIRHFLSILGAFYLIVPGLMTDLMGLLLVIPWINRFLARVVIPWLLHVLMPANLHFSTQKDDDDHSGETNQNARSDRKIIDARYKKEDI